MGNRSTSWFTEKDRKVLILSYDNKYHYDICQHLSGEKVAFPNNTGFINRKFDFQDYTLTLWVE
jgi:hypothetical protein